MRDGVVGRTTYYVMQNPLFSPWVENGLQIATFGSLRCSNNKGVVTRKDVAICKGLADYQSNQQV